MADLSIPKVKKEDLKELTPAQSMALVKKIMMDAKSKRHTKVDWLPGSLLMIKYDAKDKSQTYDKTPLVFVLKRGKSHTMCINFHWAPAPLRIVLIKKILQAPGNRKRIKEGKRLEFSYQQLKPFLKKIGMAPVIRLYINKRISRTIIPIPETELMNIARTKTETFTEGKVSAETLYKRAIKGNINYRKTRKRRE